MNRIILSILFLTSITSFGQEWIDYKVNSNVSLLIPSEYRVIDTLEHRVIAADLDYATVVLSVMPNTGSTGMNIRNEKELISGYNEFKDGYISSQKGQLLEEKIVEIQGLKSIQFSYTARNQYEDQIRYCLAFFFNDTLYVLNFWEVAYMSEEMTADREKFFSSVKLPQGLTIKNQMSNRISDNRAFQIGRIIGKLIGYGVVIGIPVLIIILISRRSRKKRELQS